MNGANPLEGISGFLRSIGLSETSASADLDAEVTRLCQERGLSATVGSSRYGILVLEAQAQHAALLKYETGALQQELVALGFVDIVEVRVRVQRT